MSVTRKPKAQLVVLCSPAMAAKVVALSRHRDQHYAPTLRQLLDSVLDGALAEAGITQKDVDSALAHVKVRHPAPA